MSRLVTTLAALLLTANFKNLALSQVNTLLYVVYTNKKMALVDKIKPLSLMSRP